MKTIMMIQQDLEKIRYLQAISNKQITHFHFKIKY